MKNTTKCLQCGKKQVRFDLRDISGFEPEEGFCSVECLDYYEKSIDQLTPMEIDIVLHLTLGDGHIVEEPTKYVLINSDHTMDVNAGAVDHLVSRGVLWFISRTILCLTPYGERLAYMVDAQVQAGIIQN